MGCKPVLGVWHTHTHVKSESSEFESRLAVGVHGLLFSPLCFPEERGDGGITTYYSPHIYARAYTYARTCTHRNWGARAHTLAPLLDMHTRTHRGLRAHTHTLCSVSNLYTHYKHICGRTSAESSLLWRLRPPVQLHLATAEADTFSGVASLELKRACRLSQRIHIRLSTFSSALRSWWPELLSGAFSSPTISKLVSTICSTLSRMCGSI